MKTIPNELSTWPRLLWMSFRGTIGTFLGFAGLIAGIAAWFIPANEKVTLATYVITLLVSLSIIVVLIEATRICYASAAHPLPRVRLSLNEGSSEDPRIVLVLEPSPHFSYGLLVSMFIVEQDQYERFFGQGIVQNVQDDGLVQVKLVELNEGFDELIVDLKGSKTQTLSRLRIKPYVQQRTL